MGESGASIGHSGASIGESGANIGESGANLVFLFLFLTLVIRLPALMTLVSRVPLSVIWLLIFAQAL